MSLNYEMARYTELTGQDGTKVSVSRLGGYLDGYEKGRNDAIDECEKEIKKHYQYDCEIGGYIRLCELNFEQLKDSK